MIMLASPVSPSPQRCGPAPVSTYPSTQRCRPSTRTLWMGKGVVHRGPEKIPVPVVSCWSLEHGFLWVHWSRSEADTDTAGIRCRCRTSQHQCNAVQAAPAGCPALITTGPLLPSAYPDFEPCVAGSRRQVVQAGAGAGVPLLHSRIGVGVCSRTDCASIAIILYSACDASLGSWPRRSD